PHRRLRTPPAFPRGGPPRRTPTIRARIPTAPDRECAYSAARPRRRTSPPRTGGASRRGARGGCPPLVAQQRADAFDRLEVEVVPQGKDGAAVGQRLVDGQVEAVVSGLHLRPVERARPAFSAHAPAARALPGRVIRALLEEQQLDPGVRGRLERVGPARRRSAAATRLLAPALGGSSLLLRVPVLEDRLRHLEQLGGRRMRVGLRPADDCVLDLVRKHLLELGPGLLRRDYDDPGTVQPPHAPVELFRDFLQVLVNEGFDVASVTRLRPAALVVPPRCLVELVDDLFEPAGANDGDRATLSPDDRDQRPVTTTDKRDERRQEELSRHRDLVVDRTAERQRPPGVVEPRAEDGCAPRAVTVELVQEVVANPGE